MRISFILPFVNPSGGVLSTFFLANALVRLGCEVYVVYPIIPPTFGRYPLNIRKKNLGLLQLLKIF